MDKFFATQSKIFFFWKWKALFRLQELIYTEKFFK